MKLYSRFGNKAVLVIVSILFLMLFGCNEGGNDGGTPTGYTGATQQATITSTNAETIVMDAFHGGAFGMGGEMDSRSHIYIITNLISNVMTHYDFKTTTINGKCGGTASFSFDINNLLNGIYKGTITFNNYCDGGATFSGTATISVTVDILANKLASVSFNLDGITFIENAGGTPYTLSGNIEYAFGINYYTIKVTNLLENGCGKTFLYQSYSLTFATSLTSITISGAGRYYHPIHGYVDISIPVSFVVSLETGHTVQGVLLVKGQNNSSAKLTILSPTTYMVECDADGDGVYEWNSGIKTW